MPVFHESRVKASVFIAAALVLGGSWAIATVDPRAWEELDIVPMPKEISLTDSNLSMDPERTVLLVGPDACEQSLIGAEWINERIRETGGGLGCPVLV